MVDNLDVRSQYEAWVYPKPIANIKAWFEAGDYQITDPSHTFHIFFPEKEKQPLDILIAGCGANQAACLSFSNSDCHFTAIDVSESSLNHTRHLKEKHNLTNLDIHHLSLFDIESLDRDFDLIISTGVLHHLPDPVAGCRALKKVLRPEGVISLMLYGKTLRTGVYLLQKAFQNLGLHQTQEDVDLVKDIISNLPNLHAIQRYRNGADDLNFDGGIVDTFLHPQDQAYDIEDLFSFIEQSSMKFHSWMDNGDYAPQNFLNPQYPGYERIMELDSKTKALVIDNLLQLRGTHRFNICHPEKANHEISLSGQEFLRLIPAHRKPIQVLEKMADENENLAKLKRAYHIFQIPRNVGLVIEQINNADPIHTIIEKTRGSLDIPAEQHDTAVQMILKDFWERGHIVLRKECPS